MVDASLFIGRSKNYISMSLQRNRKIIGLDGCVYDVKTNWEKRDWLNYERGERRMQLCCYCKKFGGGCSWSRKFEPVEGWKAVPTIIKARNRNGKYDIHSYKITECPQYEKG